MKRKAITLIVVVVMIVSSFFLICAERYQNAVYWIEEEGCFGKATAYLDEFPFIIELFDPGFVSYAYAGEAMGYGHYDEAIELLEPLADKNYRDSVQMLEHCIEQLDKSKD
jgi:hypothetical protein